ncbi:MAG: Plug domain-containing protein [Bacteroidia bacterium]|nr:Plug domain-containing protein [Bacteroidia bacterium]
MWASLFIQFSFAQTDTILPPDSLEDANLIPSFSVSADVLESEVQSQDVSGLLQSSRDAFVSAAGYNWSTARFKIRGYSSENMTVMLNGIPMNDPETQWAVWANWGGLNDITRYPMTRIGITASDLAFGGMQGFSNIDLRASTQRKGIRFSYALTNRTYRHRPMVTYNTGMMKNGWAISVSGSARFAGEGYVEGTSYSAASYFLSVDKKLNDKHMFGFVAMGSPTVQGRAGLAVQEAYDATGNNYYNPYWGYQNGVKRNSRVRDNHKPMLFLSHYFTPNEKTKLTSTAFLEFGRSGQTSLNWYDAQDPRPDYYRYLPSYFEDTDPAQAAAVAQLWATDDSYRQVNWDHMYFANSKNLYTVEDADGIAGNNVTGNRSKYILEEWRSDPLWFGAKTILNHKFSDKIVLSSGLDLQSYTSHNFKVLEDALGGDFWVDINQFALQDFSDPNASQNNLEQPNHVVRVGDVFGYNYDLHQNSGNWFGQVEFTTPKFEIFAGAQLGYTSFWRDGKFRTGLFPNDSYGQSAKNNFFTYGAKAGVTYKVTGRHYITANGLYMTRPPAISSSFLAPRLHNQILNGLTAEEVISGDFNYIIRYPNFKARATYYYSLVNNQVYNRTFWHDELRTFVNYSMTGVDQLYTGLEVGAEASVMQQFTVTGAFSWGQYLYNSRPTATVTSNNSSEVLAEDRTVYLKNYRIGGMPQTAASIGLKYSGKQYYFIGGNFNWFDQIWLDPNPDRRTSEALEGYVIEDPQWRQMLDQVRLNAGTSLNFFAGKSFRFNRKYYLLFTVNVNNALNNKNFATGGFEQLRYDRTDIAKFAPKFGYMYGTTYFAMVRFSF